MMSKKNQTCCKSAVRRPPEVGVCASLHVSKTLFWTGSEGKMALANTSCTSLSCQAA